MNAVMFKVDPLAAEHLKLDSGKVMHREAGKRGFSCNPKRSSIDGRYFAEIDRHVLKEDGTYSHTLFNVAMGTGDTPVEAAADGYRQTMPDDLLMLGFGLVARAEALSLQMLQRAETLKLLDTTLDDLTRLIRSVNVPRVTPGEDDDL